MVALYLILTTASVVFAQLDPADPTPLVSKHYAYPSEIPYQIDNVPALRGPQVGYNICNSTTENQNSMCQTAFVNGIDDFCVWAPTTPNSTIGQTEAEVVAWCTKPGHGTRLIPDGALQGVQLLRTPDYIQIVGFIDQSLININNDDAGGEMDPHGADLRGNPLGGLVYSNAFPGSHGDNNTYLQVSDWTNFMGVNFFCFKACDPARPNGREYCQNIYDRLGCSFNAPNRATKGTFEVCQADNMPPESLGPILTLPYTPAAPSSSNCVTYASNALYTGLSKSTAAPSGIPTATASSSTRKGSAAAPTDTKNSASVLSISTTAGFLGAIFAMAFLS